MVVVKGIKHVRTLAQVIPTTEEVVFDRSIRLTKLLLSNVSATSAAKVTIKDRQDTPVTIFAITLQPGEAVFIDAKGLWFEKGMTWVADVPGTVTGQAEGIY